MIHADYREKLLNKKIGILGQGNIGYNLFRVLDAEKKSLNLSIEVLTRKNLRDIDNYSFDYFFDCAGTTGDFRSKILNTVQANTSLPVFLLRNLKVSESLTVLSSSRIYGFHDDRNLVIDEEFQFATPHLSLDFIYDGSKQLMESLFFNYRDQVPYKIQLIRLSNVYGRFNASQIDDSTYLKVMIGHYLEGKPISVRHHPESSKDYLFIDDAMDGILRAALLSSQTDYFNIGSGKSFTIKDWIDFLGLNASYNNDYSSPKHCTLSIGKAQRLLSFSPDRSSSWIRSIDIRVNAGHQQHRLVFARFVFFPFLRYCFEMRTPFFSIIIPTKDRPGYLRQAIQSVLLQDFSDYELIVSDNFNGEETQRVIHEFEAEPRVRAIRTDHELPMPDHWEWATKHAQGRYVLLLPDRKLFFQHALKKIQRCILKQQEQFNVYSFAIRMYDEEKKKMGYAVPRGKSKRFSSEELIENFIHTNYYSLESYDRYFPKTMNSSYRNEFASAIRKKFGSYFSQHGVTTPDYSSMMVNLALNDEIYYLAEYCILTQGEQVSNGRLFSAGKYEAYIKSLNIAEPLELLPCKVYSSYNLNMNDFLRIRSVIGGHLTNYEIDLKNYFATIYQDLLLKRKVLGTSNSVLKTMMEQYSFDASQLPSDLQQQVKDACVLAETQFLTHTKNRITAENFPLHLYDFLFIRLQSHPEAARRLKLLFASGLDAAGFKKQRLTTS